METRGFAQRAQNLFKPSLLHKTPWLQALNLMFHVWSMAMQTHRVYKVKPDLCSRRQSKSVPMENALRPTQKPAKSMFTLTTMGKREKLKKRFCAKLRRNFFGLLLAKVCFLETRGRIRPSYSV